MSVGKLGYEPVVWHRIHSKVKLPDFYSVNGALSAKDPNKNFSKMTEEVKVSDTPDPPIEGKKKQNQYAELRIRIWQEFLQTIWKEFLQTI